MKIPDQVDVVVVVGVDASQNGVCVYDRPLHTAVAVPLAQRVHCSVDVFQLLALFLVGEKAQLYCTVCGAKGRHRVHRCRAGALATNNCA